MIKGPPEGMDLEVIWSVGGQGLISMLGLISLFLYLIAIRNDQT